MKKITIIMLTLLPLFNVYGLQSTSALKKFINLYEYDAKTEMGDKCRIDFINTLQGNIKVLIENPRGQSIVVYKDQAHTIDENKFFISEPTLYQGDYKVTRSLEIEKFNNNRNKFSVSILREFCSEDKCWLSKNICFTVY